VTGGLFAAILLLAEVTLGSWNLKWFPSGRSEHRSSPRVEAANCEDAAEVIRAGLGKDGAVLFFQELRDASATTNLVKAIGRGKFAPAITSEFRTADRRLDWQQCAIITDLPVLDSRWGYWKPRSDSRKRAPRGYAYALVDGGKDGLIACWCVHLKSNYGATTPAKRADNRYKREIAAEDLVELARSAVAPDGRRITRFVIAGDFNTDPFSGEFVDERTMAILEGGGFANCFAGLPLADRGTHPGNTRYRDSTLDFFFLRGLQGIGKPRLSEAVPLSDHRMIWLRVDGKAAGAVKVRKRTEKE